MCLGQRGLLQAASVKNDVVVDRCSNECWVIAGDSPLLFVMKIVSVKVKPNAKQQSVREEADGSLTVYLTSPPVDGKANVELIQLMAHQLGLPKSKIRIKAGHRSRNKLLEIDVGDLC